MENHFNTPAEVVDLSIKACENKTKLPVGKMILLGIMAGVFIALGGATSSTAAHAVENVGVARALAGVIFPVGLMLIVFLGGELFTGNNMVMAMGVYTKTCKVSDMIKTWVISYIGNFVGSFILGGLFVWSNASHQILVDYYRSFIYTKLDATPMELFVRGVLCNFLVCLAVYTGMKLKSESGKMIMMFCIITAFVLAGFEHCVANMGTFTIGYMLLGDIGTAAVIKSQFFVTLGNIVGGAVLLAFPLKQMSAEH